MNTPQTQKATFVNERGKSKYSPFSVIISIFLGIVFITLTQFFITDLTETIVGKRPVRDYSYNRSSYSTQMREDSQKEYETNLQQFKLKTLLVRMSVTLPLFILAIIVINEAKKQGEAYKLATRTFFIAMVINMLVFLGELASYIYDINEKFGVYAISITLLVAFIMLIVYIQDKHGKAGK